MKSGKFLFLAIIFLVSLVCISAVSAADEAVNDVIADTNDETVLQESIDDATLADSLTDELGESDEVTLDSGDDTTLGVPAPYGFSNLNDDINGNDNPVITLEHDYVCYINEFNDGVTISRNLTIDGNGYTISGYNRARIFNIQSDVSVVLKNINFIDGNASGNGGAINCQGTVTAINCNFTNNYAENWGGAIERGTAINCTFTNNYAERFGGAIDDGNATNCVFINNYANTGGAIWAGDYDATVVNCSFIGNNATEYGGAVDYAKVINCNFTNNTCSNYGGAIYDGEAINCIFTGNIASWGGAMASNSEFDICIAENCIFTNNSVESGDGGAIYKGNATKCDFNSNIAQFGNGAAICYGEATDCTFTGNYAFEYGGAICNGSATNCNFTHNTAYYGYGGGIYNGNAINCTFIDQYTDSSGGAMCGDIITNELCYATNCTFINNSAYGTAGAIYQGFATNCIFSGSRSGNIAGINDRVAMNGGFADSCVFNGDTCLNVDIYQPTLSMSNFISTYGSPDKLKVNFTSNSGMQIDNANILISVYTTAGSFVGNYTALSGGWKVPLNVGAYLVTYTAKDFDIDSVQNIIVIDKAKSVISSAAVTAVYNNNKYLVITLKDAYGKAISGAKVTVTLASAKTYTTDKNGQIKINIGTLVPKTYTAKISFAGNTNFLASSTTAKVVVKKATPKLTAKAKTFKVNVKTKKYTITLKNNKGKVMKKAKLTLKVGKKTYKATTNSKGKATFKITKLTKKGKYTAVIKYAGNKYYKKLTKKVKITIKE